MKKLLLALLALSTCATPAFAGKTFGLCIRRRCGRCCNSCATFCVRQYNAFSPVASGSICCDGFLPIGSPGCAPGTINYGGIPTGGPCCANGSCNAPDGMAYFGGSMNMGASPSYPVSAGPSEGEGEGEGVTSEPMQMPHVAPAPLPATTSVQPTNYRSQARGAGYAPGAASYVPGMGYYVPNMMANPYYTAPSYWNGAR